MRGINFSWTIREILIKRQVLISILCIMTVILILIQKHIYEAKTRRAKYITMTHSLSALSSDQLDWPIYINFEKGYSVGYPRELIIREIPAGNVEFDLPVPSHNQVVIHMEVIQDSPKSAFEKWVMENHLKKGEGRIENLRKLTVKNFPAVEFFNTTSPCIEACDYESVSYQLVIKKETALLTFSCEKCPANIESIWQEMATSFQPLSNSYIQSFADTESRAYDNIKFVYPKGWFFKPYTPQSFTISSYDTEGYFSGSYQGGIEIGISRCDLAFPECIENIGLKGTDLLDSDLVQSLGGVVETIDMPTMKGVIYGQMDPTIYQDRSMLNTILMVNKQNGTTVELRASLSRWGGDFELIKRMGLYYFPTLKMIAQNLKVL